VFDETMWSSVGCAVVRCSVRVGVELDVPESCLETLGDAARNVSGTTGKDWPLQLPKIVGSVSECTHAILRSLEAVSVYQLSFRRGVDRVAKGVFGRECAWQLC
jgi:hypothetical protein